MKIKMLLTMLFMGTLISLSAQTDRTPQDKAMDEAKSMTAQMDSYLNLSPEQEEKITEINQSYYHQRSKLNDLDRDQKAERMKGALAQYHRDVQAELNPEQVEKFDAKWDETKSQLGEMKEERHDRRQNDMEEEHMDQKGEM